MSELPEDFDIAEEHHGWVFHGRRFYPTEQAALDRWKAIVNTIRVALLRELAAELEGKADARWSGWVYSASVAEDIAKMLSSRADALEGK